MLSHPTDCDRCHPPASEAASPDHGSRRRTFTVAEAAEALGISRASAYECVRTGELPSIRLGGRILVPVKLLDQLLEGC